MDMQHYIDSISGILLKKWNKTVLSDIGGREYTGGELAAEIEKLRLMYQAMELAPGSRIALYTTPSSKWIITFLSAGSSGMIPVSIPKDASGERVQQILKETECAVLFTDETRFAGIAPSRLPNLKLAVNLSEWGCLMASKPSYRLTCNMVNVRFRTHYIYGFENDLMHFTPGSPEDIAILNFVKQDDGTISESAIPGDLSSWLDKPERSLARIPMTRSIAYSSISKRLKHNLGGHIREISFA